MASKKPMFKLIDDSFEDLRQDPKVEAFLQAKAEQVAKAAGPGFEVQEALGARRARRRIVPTTEDAYRANYENYAAIRALGAASD